MHAGCCGASSWRPAAPRDRRRPVGPALPADRPGRRRYGRRGRGAAALGASGEGDGIAPAQFIGVAEQAGLIELLGAWILREAVRQAAEWPAPASAAASRGSRSTCSSSSSPTRRWPARSSSRCATTGCRRAAGARPTESAVVRDIVTATHRLDAISALGERIGVDDFGEGPSPWPTSPRSRSTCRRSRRRSSTLSAPDATSRSCGDRGARALVRAAHRGGGDRGARPDGAPAPGLRP